MPPSKKFSASSNFNVCVVPKCKNTGVHLFPQETVLLNLWLAALKPGGKVRVKKQTALCSEHFEKTDLMYTSSGHVLRKLQDNAVPSIFPWTPAKKMETKDRLTVYPRRIIKSYSRNKPDLTNIAVKVESIEIEVDPLSVTENYNSDTCPFEEHKYTLPSAIQDCEIQSSANNDDNTRIDLENDSKADHERQGSGNNDLLIDLPNEDNIVTVKLEKIDCGYGCCHSYLDNTSHEKEEKKCLKRRIEERKEMLKKQERTKEDVNITVEKPLTTVIPTQTEEPPTFSCYPYRNNDNAVHYYTGLGSYERFVFVFKSLDTKNNLIFKKGPLPSRLFDPLEQFFLVLIMLRQHKTMEELSYMYSISPKQLRNIFVTWVKMMARKWKSLKFCVQSQSSDGENNLNYDKFSTMNDTEDTSDSAWINPTEPSIKKCKTACTVKTFIGVSTSGFIMSVSPCHYISKSDVRGKHSNTDTNARMRLVDEVSCITLNINVNTAAFLKKGNTIGPNNFMDNHQLTGYTKNGLQRKALGFLGAFKILSQSHNMNPTETMLVNEIVFICAMLVNFRSMSSLTPSQPPEDLF